MDQQEIETRFTYHAPKGNQAERYAIIRAAFKRLAYLVNDLAPDSREQSVAITHLEQASFWANAAIARRE